MMELWGLKRVMGSLWTVLDLTGEPLGGRRGCASAWHLQRRRLDDAGRLERWGGVVEALATRREMERVLRGGDDIWKMVVARG